MHQADKLPSGLRSHIRSAYMLIKPRHWTSTPIGAHSAARPQTRHVRNLALAALPYKSSMSNSTPDPNAKQMHQRQHHQQGTPLGSQRPSTTAAKHTLIRRPHCHRPYCRRPCCRRPCCHHLYCRHSRCAVARAAVGRAAITRASVDRALSDCRSCCRHSRCCREAREAAAKKAEMTSGDGDGMPAVMATAVVAMVVTG